ncbi:pilus assembly protein TadG-related protein [Brevibacterium pityocampae]
MKKDDGQVSLTVILLSLMLLAAAVGAFVFGESIDDSSKAQKSADSAALGAARDARDALIWSYATGHIAPTNATDPILTSWLTQWQSASYSPEAVAGAHSYADRNGSAVTRYDVAGDAITVDVATKTRKVVSPVGSKAVDTLSSPATATAQVDATGISCYTSVHREPNTRTVISWTVTCVGRGAIANANYIGPQSSAPSLNMTEWQKLFDIRLTN